MTSLIITNNDLLDIFTMNFWTPNFAMLQCITTKADFFFFIKKITKQNELLSFLRKRNHVSFHVYYFDEILACLISQKISLIPNKILSAVALNSRNYCSLCSSSALFIEQVFPEKKRVKQNQSIKNFFFIVNNKMLIQKQTI